MPQFPRIVLPAARVVAASGVSALAADTLQPVAEAAGTPRTQLP